VLLPGRQVLQVMCGNHVHRVYVREKGHKPHEVMAVITPTDILKLLAGSAGLMNRQASTKRGAEEASAMGNNGADCSSASAEQEATAQQPPLEQQQCEEGGKKKVKVDEGMQ